MYLIAEIGINHNGNMDLVDSMIRKAAECGADAVKFQKRSINNVYTKEFLDSPRESPWGKTQRVQKEGLELSFNDYCEIDLICKEVGIEWFASSWDFDSLGMMDSFNPPFHKIASAFNVHIPFMQAVAKMNRPVMLSTGMSDLVMVHKAIKVLEDAGAVKIIIMHCVSIYPCPDELCNINAINTYKVNFPEHEVGYSGHERGIEPSLMAVGLGAKYIERHFTMDRASYGSDQSASLEPPGLARIREYGDQIEKCMGNGTINIQPLEHKAADSLRYWLK